MYFTEYGWDSAGGGEGCDFAKCVSEVAQARYLVRASLILARFEYTRASVFFYANLDPDGDEPEGTFSRSGLTAYVFVAFFVLASVLRVVCVDWFAWFAWFVWFVWFCVVRVVCAPVEGRGLRAVGRCVVLASVMK